MGERPEEIRSEIEETRDRISAEIDELTDRYSPGRVAGRKIHGARDAAASIRAKAGSGTAGMRQRLTLRGSGHLGEGHTGNGEAGAAGARLADADNRGQWETRGTRHPREEGKKAGKNESHGRFLWHRRRAGQHERIQRTDGAVTVGSPDYEPYPAEAFAHGDPAATPERGAYGYAGAGQGAYASGTGEPHAAGSAYRGAPAGGSRAGHEVTERMTPTAGHAPDEPFRDPALERRPREHAGTGYATSREAGEIAKPGHGREIGLAGASVAMAAVGARLVRHAGRRETMLRAAADSNRPYGRPDIPARAVSMASRKATEPRRSRRPS